MFPVHREDANSSVISSIWNLHLWSDQPLKSHKSHSGGSYYKIYNPVKYCVSKYWHILTVGETQRRRFGFVLVAQSTTLVLILQHSRRVFSFLCFNVFRCLCCCQSVATMLCLSFLRRWQRPVSVLCPAMWGRAWLSLSCCQFWRKPRYAGYWTPTELKYSVRNSTFVLKIYRAAPLSIFWAFLCLHIITAKILRVYNAAVVEIAVAKHNAIYRCTPFFDDLDDGGRELLFP